MDTGSVRGYLDLILVERHWSWTLPVALYLLAGLVLRGAVLGGLITRARFSPSRFFASIRHHYLRRALPGWFFFYAAAFLLAYVWIKTPSLPVPEGSRWLLAGALLSFVWSLVLHSKALASAALDTLREASAEKEAEMLLKTQKES